MDFCLDADESLLKQGIFSLRIGEAVFPQRSVITSMDVPLGYTFFRNQLDLLVPSGESPLDEKLKIRIRVRWEEHYGI